MDDFVVGDLVEYIGELNGVYGPRAGSIGTVVRIRNLELQCPILSIQFDTPYTRRSFRRWSRVARPLLELRCS